MASTRVQANTAVFTATIERVGPAPYQILCQLLVAGWTSALIHGQALLIEVR